MALDIDIKKPSVKYGAAQNLNFGVPASEDFDIVESSSQTASFDTDIKVKNEVGITVGSVLGDPKIELTLSGLNKTAPVALGAVTEFKNYLAGIGTGASPETSDNEKFVVKQVKADFSNEDFVKYELTAEAYPNMNYDNSADLSDADTEFGN